MRRFSLRSTGGPARGTANLLVSYRDDMTLRIPLTATNLASPRLSLAVKLTRDALTEFLALAEQCEARCPVHPKTSGAGLRQSNAKPSPTNSSQSCSR